MPSQSQRDSCGHTQTMPMSSVCVPQLPVAVRWSYTLRGEEWSIAHHGPSTTRPEWIAAGIYREAVEMWSQ